MLQISLIRLSLRVRPVTVIDEEKKTKKKNLLGPVKPKDSTDDGIGLSLHIPIIAFPKFTV